MQGLLSSKMEGVLGCVFVAMLGALSILIGSD